MTVPPRLAMLFAEQSFLCRIYSINKVVVVRALYLFLDGGALLVILAGFLCIRAGGHFGGLFAGAGGRFGGLFAGAVGRFGGLFGLVLGTFPAPLVAFARYCWTHIGRLRGLSCLDQLLVGIRMLLVSLSALISSSASSSSPGFLLKRTASSSVLKSLVFKGESSLRGSVDVVFIHRRVSSLN